MSLPTNRWTALVPPPEYASKGLPGTQKHVSAAWCAHDQRTYFLGGDYPFDGFFDNSYRQEMLAFSLRDRLAAPTDRNAGWALIDPYVAAPGTIKLKHPDLMGFDYDAGRDGFWSCPGLMVPPGIDNVPPGETTKRESDPQYRFNSVMFFDRATRRWTEISTSMGQWFGGLRPVRDPVGDQIIRFDYDGGWGLMASHFDCTTALWTTGAARSGPFYNANGPGHDVRIEQERLALNVEDRIVYAIDPLTGRLHAYDLRTKRMADLGVVSGNALTLQRSALLHGHDLRTSGFLLGGNSGWQGWGFLEWIPSLKRLAHWSLRTGTAQLIDPVTMAVTALPTMTDNGAPLQGLLFYYDPSVHALVLQGQEPGIPFMFVLGLPGSPPPPIPPPTPGDPMATVTVLAELGGIPIPVPATAGFLLSLTPASVGGSPMTAWVPGAAGPPVQAVFASVAPGDYLAGAALLTAPGGTVLKAAPPVSVTVPSSVTLQGPIGVTASVTFA